ncbi:MAG: adenylate/guanylate cyclase domain-containing protein [Verrucomicrobiota bacterium]
MAFIFETWRSEGAAKVLLVDDNPINLSLLHETLENEGYEILVAQDGSEALRTASMAKPDLILLDVNMPGSDGFETCRLLKSKPETKDIVVIFLSGRDAVDDRLQGFRLGAVDYICKPFEHQELVSRVNVHIQLKQARSGFLRLQRQSDSLLENIFPVSIVERLRSDRGSVVDYFPEATILFCDLVGFTEFCSDHSPETIYSHLSGVFSLIDRLVQEHSLEKIKTIGDAYMIASGVPDEREDHADAMADLALDLLRAAREHEAEGGFSTQMRIGIHSGAVVAGVIGEKRLAYDLWGDTVNLAQRMEANGFDGKIHVSAATRKRLSSRFLVEKRGLIDIKGKSFMETFFLVGEKD